MCLKLLFDKDIFFEIWSNWGWRKLKTWTRSFKRVNSPASTSDVMQSCVQSTKHGHPLSNEIRIVCLSFTEVFRFLVCSKCDYAISALWHRIQIFDKSHIYKGLNDAIWFHRLKKDYIELTLFYLYSSEETFRQDFPVVLKHSLQNY